MNGLEQAERKIEEFLNSDEKFCFISGTHQFEKHKLVMKVLNNNMSNASKILFRTNGMDMVHAHFKNLTTLIKTGVGYNFGNSYLFFDTLRSSTWNKTPHKIDYAIIYPIDSFIKSKKVDDSIEDLLHRSTQKIFIVSWTDLYDYSMLDKYNPLKVIYDAEEEDPEYNNRVLYTMSEIKK